MAVACVGGGSNAIGLLTRFIGETSVRGWSAWRRRARGSRAAMRRPSLAARPGVLHGSRSLPAPGRRWPGDRGALDLGRARLPGHRAAALGAVRGRALEILERHRRGGARGRPAADPDRGHPPGPRAGARHRRPGRPARPAAARCAARGRTRSSSSACPGAGTRTSRPSRIASWPARARTPHEPATLAAPVPAGPRGRRHSAAAGRASAAAFATAAGPVVPRSSRTRWRAIPTPTTSEAIALAAHRRRRGPRWRSGCPTPTRWRMAPPCSARAGRPRGRGDPRPLHRARRRASTPRARTCRSSPWATSTRSSAGATGATVLLGSARPACAASSSPTSRPTRAPTSRPRRARLGIGIVYLVTPTTPPERRASSPRAARGSSTRSRWPASRALARRCRRASRGFLRDVRAVSPVPVAVGFGVSTAGPRARAGPRGRRHHRGLGAGGCARAGRPGRRADGRPGALPAEATVRE